jgi:fibronectin-binding autotransporter adhesin
MLLTAVAATAAATVFMAGPALTQAATVTLTATDAAGSNSFNLPGHWSDGNAPSAASDYLVSGGFALRTPASATIGTTSIAFLGNSLTLGNGTTTGQLTDKNTSAFNITTINNFTMNDGIIQNGGDNAGTAWTDIITGNGITVGTGGATFDSGTAGRSIILLDSVGGVGNVIVTSTGSIQYYASNSYAGTTTVNTGSTLILAASNAISGNGNVTVTGTLLANAVNSISGNGNITVAGILQANGANAITGNGAITISGTLFANGNNAIAGTGNIALTGGTLVLNSTENFTGLISFGTGTGNLDYSNSNATDYSNQIKNSTTSIDINTNGQFVNFASSLDASNTGGLTKNNGGTLSLSGTNAYTGTTTIAAGVLQVNSAGALGSGTGLISFTGGTLQYTANNTTDYSSRFPVLATTGGNAYRIDTNGQTVSFASPLVNDTATGTLAKLGAGTLNLSATNTYTGATSVLQGVLNVNANVTGNVINATSTLSLQGGTFQITGDGVGGADAQTVASTTISVGDSNLSLVQNGAASVNLNLGALIHVTGATINFAQGSTASAAFNTTTGTAGALINDAGVAFATVGGTDWAAKDLTNTFVVGGSTLAGFYTPDTTSLITGNADVGTTNTTLLANGTSTSLRFNDGTGPRTLNLGGFYQTTGGILVTSNVGNNLETITGGTFSSAATTANKDLEIIQNNTANGLIIGSVITNNTSGTSTVVTGLTKSGPGLLTLSAVNTYTGPTTVSAGTLNIPTGGTIATTANVVTVGNSAGHNAVLSITGTVNANDTAVGQNGGSVLIGNAMGAVGDIQVGIGGVLTAGEQINIGNGAGGYAALSNNGGTITSGTYLVVGFGNDKAVYNQTAGTYTVTGDTVTISANPGAVGLMNVSGGTFNSTAAIGGNQNAGAIFVGEVGQGTLNVSGTAAINLSTTNAGGLSLGTSNTAASGTVNLLGGTLAVPLVTRGTGSGFFNFNGGTLKAEIATTNFMNGLSGAYVYGGSTGSTIDNNSLNITIGQSLIAPTGNGISSIGLTSGGTGYVDSPLVSITGGGGTGATAVANVNPATGQVTGISITNPGVGYTGTPTVSLSGGGGSGAVLGTIAGAPNSTGGTALNFKGAGTTTLLGVNTYTGNTNVTGGTLLLPTSASLAATGHLTISSSAALQGSGNVGLTTLSGGGILNVGNSNSIIGTLTASSLTSTGGATPSVFNFWMSSTSYDQVTVTNPGGLNLGGGTLNLLAAGGNTAFSTPGTYNLFNINGGISGSTANLKIGNAQPGDSYTFNTTGTAVSLTIATVSSFTWDNHSNSDENYTNANNWAGNAAPPSAAGTVVTFGTANTTGNGTVNLNSSQTIGAMILDSGVGGSLSYNIIPTISTNTLTFSNPSTPAGIAVNNGTHSISANMVLASPTTISGAAGTSLTLAGNISGANGLTVSTSGTVLLTGTNSYTTTTITGGTLQVGNATSTGSLGSGATALSSGANLIFNLSNPLTLGGPITGGGAVTQNGTSTVSLSPTGNTFANLAVNSGTLDLNGNSLSLTAFSGSGNGSFNPGTGIITDNSATSGTTTLTYAGSVTSTFSGSINDGPTQHIAVAMGVTGGTLALLGSSSYSGGTTINQGNILVTATTNGLGTTNGTTTGVITMNALSSPTRLLVGNSATIANPIVITAANAGVGNGAIQAADTTNTTFTGPITVNAQTVSGGDIVGPASGTMIFTNSIIASSAVQQFIVRSGDVQFADSTGLSSYPVLGITGPGTVTLGHNNGIATNTVIEPGLNNTAGTLDLSGFNQTVGGITQPTAAVATIETNEGPSTLTVNTPSTTAVAPFINFPDSAPDTYAGILTDNSGGTGPLSLIKAGPGTLLLTGANNPYIGGTTIAQGVLGAAVLSNGGTAGSVGFSSLIGAANSNVIFSATGGILRYTGVSASTNQALVVNPGVVGELDISTAATALTWQGGLSGGNTPTGFIKGGPGTLTIDTSFTNSYSGNTTVSAGTMVVNGSLGTSGTGSHLSIASGATLVGTGTISGSLDHTAGTISGGTVGTVGTLAFTDPLKLDGGTALFDINGGTLTGDLIQANGGLTFGAASETINLQIAGTVPTSTFTYELFTYNGAAPATSNLTYTSNIGRATFSTLLTNSGQVDVVVNPHGGTANLDWSSSTSGVWDTTTPNWYGGATLGTTAFFTGDNLTFGDNNTAAPPGTAQLTTAISLAASQQPSSVTVSSNSNNYTISGAGGIAGTTTTLTMTGTSTLTLETNNTYGGGTTINHGGTIILGAGTANGTLGSGPIINNGNLVISRNDATPTFANTISNSTSGQGNLTYNGGAVATFSGAVSQGAITVTGANSAARFTAALSSDNDIVIGTSTADLVGGLTSTVGIAGNGGITLNAGTANITGSNSFQGQVIINGGLYNQPSATGLGTTGVTINAGEIQVDAATNFGAVPLTLNGPTEALEQGGNATSTYSGPIIVTAPTGIHMDGGAGITFSNATISSSNNSGLTANGDGGATFTVGGNINLGTGVLTNNIGGANGIIFNPSLSGTTNATVSSLAGAGTMQINAVAGNTVTFTSLNTYTGNTLVNSGTLTVNPASNISSTANVNVAAGAVLNVNGSIATTATLNDNGGNVNFGANTGAGILARTLTAVNLGTTTTSTVTLAAPATQSQRTVLVTGALGINGLAGAWLGVMDMTSNDMIVHNTSTVAAATTLANITSQIQEGYNNGTWTGAAGGITSSSAAAVAASLAAHTTTGPQTVLGIEVNNFGTTPTALFSTFDGQTVTTSDVLVKYTMVGDADLSGHVNGTDYTLIDNGFNSQPTATPLTGWRNGDFNYDGKINGDDYTLIDNSFNTEGATTFAAISAGPANMIASNTDQVASPAAVPEPTTLSLLTIGAAGLLSRRRRRA